MIKWLLILAIVLGSILGFYTIKKFTQLGQPPKTEKPAPAANVGIVGAAPIQAQTPSPAQGAPLETPPLAISLLNVQLKFSTAKQVLEKLVPQLPGDVKAVQGETNDSIILHGTDYQALSAFSEIVRQMDLDTATITVRCMIVRRIKGNSNKIGLFNFLEDLGSNDSSIFNDLLNSLTYDLATGITTFGGNFAAQQFLQILSQFVSVDSRFSILAQPNLSVTSGKSATFASGREVPIPVTTRDASGSQTSVQYKQAEFRFTVTPTVLPSGVVRLSIEQSNSDVLSEVKISGDQVPILSVQKLQTEIDLKENQLLYLGGIDVETASDENRGTPYLRKVPGVNLIFGTQTKNTEKSELCVLLTVSLYRGDDHPARIVKPQTSSKVPPRSISLGEKAGSNPTPATSLRRSATEAKAAASKHNVRRRALPATARHANPEHVRVFLRLHSSERNSSRLFLRRLHRRSPITARSPQSWRVRSHSKACSLAHQVILCIFRSTESSRL